MEFLFHLNSSCTYFEAWGHLSPTYRSGSISNAAEINSKAGEPEVHMNLQ